MGTNMAGCMGWLMRHLLDINVVCEGPPMFREDKTLVVPHSPASALRVTTCNGSVAAKKADRTDVLIVARFCGDDEARLKAARILADREADGTLVVLPDWPDGARRGREGCAIEVLIPDARGVHIEASNGGIAASGLAGAARLKTTNGAISAAKHDGDVEAETTNGSVRLEDIAGAARARTSNGRVELLDCRGAVGAGTSNAEVVVRLARSNPGPVRVRTSNGGVRLTLGPAFAGELGLATSNGAVRVEPAAGIRTIEASKCSERLVAGSSAAASEARTSNGSIHVQFVENL